MLSRKGHHPQRFILIQRLVLNHLFHHQNMKAKKRRPKMLRKERKLMLELLLPLLLKKVIKKMKILEIPNQSRKRKKKPKKRIQLMQCLRNKKDLFLQNLQV